jgi:hypothetical protein
MLCLLLCHQLALAWALFVPYWRPLSIPLAVFLACWVVWLVIRFRQRHPPDRTRLRNQIIIGAGFAVWWALKVFWLPDGMLRYWAAGAVGLFMWLAGVAYVEYRDTC